MRATLALGVAVAAISLSLPAFSAPASVPYSTSGASLTGIGNQLPSGTYDKLTLGATTGTIGSSGDYDFGTITWAVGINTLLSSKYTASGSIADSVTINGVTKNISIPFVATINFISDVADAISFESISSASFGPNVEVSFLEPASLIADAGGKASEELMGVVTNTTPVIAAPEINPASAPSGLALFLGVIAVICGRRVAKSPV